MMFRSILWIRQRAHVSATNTVSAIARALITFGYARVPQDREPRLEGFYSRWKRARVEAADNLRVAGQFRGIVRACSGGSGAERPQACMCVRQRDHRQRPGFMFAIKWRGLGDIKAREIPLAPDLA